MQANPKANEEIVAGVPWFNPYVPLLEFNPSFCLSCSSVFEAGANKQNAIRLSWLFGFRQIETTTAGKLEGQVIRCRVQTVKNISY